MAYEIDEDIFRFPRYSERLERELCRASRDEILDIQSRRLKLILQYCWDHMHFYRKMWEQAGVSPDDIRTSEDIVKLPAWNKEVQRQEIDANPPYGSYYCNTDTRNVGYLLSSGGTTGIPRIFPVLKTDLPGLQDIQARTIQFVGVTEDDVVQVCTHYSAFAGAWCGTWAVEGAGATLVPAGSGKSLPSVRQVDLINRMGVTVLRTQASYAEHLAKVAREEGLDPAALKMRIILTAGESYSRERRARIEKTWNAKVYDFFGSADTFSWSSVDCEHSRSELGTPGMHVWEDSCIVEVLDQDGKPVEPGELGELTLTTFNWRNSPRIRFRTGDLVALYPDRCACGRNLARMSPVMGRVDHVVRLRGINIYPGAIDTVISNTDSRLREFYAVASREADREMLYLVVEWSDQNDGEIVKKIQKTMSNQLSISPEVKLVPIGSTAQKTGIDGSLNKPRRLFDERSK